MLIIINLVWYPWSIEWLWTLILINNGTLSHLRSKTSILHNVLLQLGNLLPQDFHQTIMMFLFLTHFISTQISNANSNKKLRTASVFILPISTLFLASTLVFCAIDFYLKLKNKDCVQDTGLYSSTQVSKSLLSQWNAKININEIIIHQLSSLTLVILSNSSWRYALSSFALTTNEWILKF